MKLRLLAIVLLIWVPFCTHAKEFYELKFATLAPEGTSWMNVISDWAQQVETRSNGRIKFKIYPGGAAGDEPDVLRKIRFKQLHGGAFTGYGIGNIYSPARVLEMPFLFKSYDETDYVRDILLPEIKEGFRKNGFEAVGWMEVGFVRLFSNIPIRSIQDLKKSRIWLWQGDPLAEAFFAEAGISPIPLSIQEVFTSLSTGLIDTVYAPPMGAIALQWFTKTSYVSEMVLANGIGALVISELFMQTLPDDLQKLVRDTGELAGKRLIDATRVDNEEGLKVLHEDGLEFISDWDQEDEKRIPVILDKAQLVLAKKSYIPEELFERVQNMLTDFRAGKIEKTDQVPETAPPSNAVESPIPADL